MDKFKNMDMEITIYIHEYYLQLVGGGRRELIFSWLALEREDRGPLLLRPSGGREAGVPNIARERLQKESKKKSAR